MTQPQVITSVPTIAEVVENVTEAHFSTVTTIVEMTAGYAGKSAYDLWTQEGNTWSVQDFLDSLQWENGVGVPTGGAVGEFLKKTGAGDFTTGWAAITITDVTGLSSALNAKADLIDGKVPSSQLPSYVDDVVEVANYAALPITGETGKIYVTLNDNKTYRWSGSAYVEISASLALGETSATAYRWDRGKTAYDHSQLTGNPHGTTITDITGLGTALDSKVNESLTLTINGVSYDLSENRSWTVSGGGGTPAGSTSYIQYNTGGAFDAKSTFIFMEELDAVGIQVATPLAAFHTSSSTGSTLSPITTGAITLVSEVVINAPGGSIIKIAEPEEWSGGNVSFIDQASGSFTGDGTTYYFRVYPCLKDGSTYYRSQFYETVSNTIPNDSDTYNIQVNWWSVSISGETVEYFIEYSTNDSDYYPSGVYSWTSAVIYSLSGSDSTTSWNNTYKQWWGIVADAPVSFDSWSENISYSGFYSDGKSYEYQVDTYKDISGTKYVSWAPITVSFSDNNSLQNFAWDLYWTLTGSYDGVILRRQINGSGWSYIDLGSSSSYTDDNFTDDGVSSSIWGNTYSGADITFTFDVKGRGTSPSGQIYYSSDTWTYSTIIFSGDTSRYIFKHTFSGMPDSGAKIFAPSSTFSYAKNINDDYVDNGYTSWLDSTAYTPTSYWFSWTQQNREYFLHSSGSGIFASVAYELDTTNSWWSKSVEITGITYPVGISTIRVYRRINGTGNYFYKTISSPTSSFIDDALDTTWTNAGSSYPPSPNSIVPGAGRFDRNNTARNDPTILDIVATGSGTRYPKITFSVATDSSSTPTRIADILVNSSTGFMELVTGRVEFMSNFWATPYAIISSFTFFNNTKSSTGHFTVSWANDSFLINTRADQDTVGFGQAIGSDQQATVQMQAVRSSDTPLVIIWHTSQTNSNSLIRLQTSAGAYTWEITLGGWWRGGTWSATDAALSTRSDTNTWFYFPSADTIGVTTWGVQRVRINTEFSLLTTRFNLFNWVTENHRLDATNVNWLGNSTGAPWRVGFGQVTSPTAKIHIGAWSAGASTAPLKFNSGALMTTPEVGAVEFLTNKWYGTITTGAARREFIMGDNAITDGVNLVFGTVTGTKIASAANQKLSFWNATPIVQPTTSLAGATLVSPGGWVNIKTDDTFDGYTIQQVVKGLRNIWLFA